MLDDKFKSIKQNLFQIIYKMKEKVTETTDVKIDEIIEKLLAVKK